MPVLRIRGRAATGLKAPAGRQHDNALKLHGAARPHRPLGSCVRAGLETAPEPETKTAVRRVDLIQYVPGHLSHLARLPLEIGNRDQHRNHTQLSPVVCGIDYGILLVWFLFFVFARHWIQRLHGRWFRLSNDQFDAIHYAGMSVFKIGIVLLNLVPYVVLWIVG